MARPRKNTVEYFPHQCDHGKTMFIIQKKYGNNGYAFWFKMLELLGKSEGHFLDLNDPADWEYLLSYAHMDDETCIEILNLLAKLEAIDAELWEEKIIWCQKFVDGISDVYANRRIETPAKPSFYRQKPTSAVVSTGENPQSKVKETKVKDSIVSLADNDNIFQFYSKHFSGTLTSVMAEKLGSYLDDGLEEPVIIHAMNSAVENNKRTFSYLQAILDNYLAKGIKTMAAVKDEEEKFRSRKTKTEEKTPYKKYEPEYLKVEKSNKGMESMRELVEKIKSGVKVVEG